MPNAPSQFPQFDLPQAEFFNLAPNAQIALGPRLAQTVGSTPTTVVAASAQGFVQNFPLIINPAFATSQALYLVRGQIALVPVDSSAHLQVQSVRMGLGGPGGIGLDIGIPTGTLSTPSQPTIIMYERDALITWLDFNPPATGPLQMTLFATVGVLNTDTVNPHSFTITIQAVWHNLSGFVQ